MQKVSNRLAPFLLGAASLFIALAALLFCLSAGDPVFLSCEGSPEEAVTVFLDELCAGNYKAASACCLVPLPEENAPSDADAALLYNALRESTDWEFSGRQHQSGHRAQMQVTLHHVDTAALTDGLKEAVLENLARYVEEAAHSRDIYNDDGSYRDEIVMKAWDEALESRLAHQEDYMTATSLPLSLTAEDGSWKIIPDAALTAALSGGV